MQALAFVVVEAVVLQQDELTELLGGDDVQLGAVRQVSRLVEHDLAVGQMGFERLHSGEFWHSLALFSTSGLLGDVCRPFRPLSATRRPCAKIEMPEPFVPSVWSRGFIASRR